MKKERRACTVITRLALWLGLPVKITGTRRHARFTVWACFVVYHLVWVYNVDMDEKLLQTMIAADAPKPPRKWRVKVTTLIRSKPIVGRQMGNCYKDFVFTSNWIWMGWISIYGINNQWVRSADVEEVFDEPADQQPTDLYRLLHDFELPERYRKGDRNGVPETVRFYHEGNGNIRFTRELQEALYHLNQPLDKKIFSKLFDTWNRKGEKISEGRRNYITGENLFADYAKYPFELSFGGNTIRARRVLKWAGGMGIAKGTTVIECDTLNPSKLPADLRDLIGTPYIHHLVTVANGRANPFVYRGGRDGLPCYTVFTSPVPLYIEAERCQRVESVVSPYVLSGKL